ncbi:MAG: insulinase family protein [Bacteroidales bacterium]|nr:insulinase family protein [Bacteroidales bacterium]
MKKTIFFFVTLACCAFSLHAQQKPIKVETHYLSNGLKVIMAEEHSQPKIYGAVMVHAGSKNEDTAATGVAHYFEHIMFKGTDRIGTTNWAMEKPLLDSISDLYDQIQATSDPARRHELQLEINRLNIEASKYAIANETDAILQQMGCTGLNAFTSFDVTCYHNTLPSNQLENWMEVYAERFRNPVYRLFQGELEAVYEERNIHANGLMYTFQRNIFTEAFGEHPYSRDVIGHDHHLKNPQPSAMKKFYDKYYVASNMALILVGDFNTAEALKMAEKYFSIWPKGEKVKEPEYKLPTFDSPVVKNVKQTPIKVGLMVFPAVKANDPDELLLDVMSSIISGGNGRLDELTTRGELMAAQQISMPLIDAGLNAILYVPKLLGQKHEEAEELIWAAIDSVKEGRFSDELLTSIKVQDYRSRQSKIESYRTIADLLQGLEMNNSNYEEWLRDGERMQKITREDIMNVAKKYFDRDHCTIIRSKMGFPAKAPSIKPDWDHLEAQNKGEQTEFAKHIASRKIEEIKPQVIDFKKDVTVVTVSENCKLYASKNPKNDIFSLTINYHYGSFDNHNISEAMQYFDNLGAGDMTREEFKIKLECLGGTLSLSSDNDYSYIKITGLEENMEKIIDLVMLKLEKPRHDQQQLDNLVQNLRAAKKEAKNESSIWKEALWEYVMYGDQSEYINHATIEEIQKMKGEDLMAIINEMYGRDGYVTFIGNSEPKVVADLLRQHNLVRDNVTVMEKRIRKPKDFTEDALFYATNKKFLKSDLDLFIPSSTFDYLADRAACSMFNEYMGGGMNSVFFQEIREFRSLGYSTYGYFTYDRLNRRPAFFYAYLGTQCDKTNDGIAAMKELMVNFPDREEKFYLSRDYLVSVRNSNYLTFRSIPQQVRDWMENEKLTSDPRIEITKQIRDMKYEDLKAFHKKYVAGRPFVAIITGNAKQFDLKDLKKYGPVKEIKYKNIIKF